MQFGGREFTSVEQSSARLYVGQRGIFRDKNNTATERFPDGITQAVLHLGDRYDDDLLEDGVLYHYPSTKLPGYDKGDVQATKNAKEAGIPIFVLVGPKHRRFLYLGVVADWDDESELFLIRFVSDFSETGNETEPQSDDSEPFVATVERKERESRRKVRSSKFEFYVRKRYGMECALCSMTVPQILEAAHIRAVKDNGSDDPRNGLVLCRNHHRAFDQLLYTIDADTHEFIWLHSDGARTLQATKSKLVGNKPHADVLKWHNTLFYGQTD